MDKETRPRRSSPSWSSISPEPRPGQMHFAAHPTPSPRSPLYLAVPPHTAGIDQPAGSISRFLLRYLSAPSISQSALLSAMPVYTYSIYPRRLHRARRYPFVWGISLSLHLGASPGPEAEQEGFGDTALPGTTGSGPRGGFTWGDGGCCTPQIIPGSLCRGDGCNPPPLGAALIHGDLQSEPRGAAGPVVLLSPPNRSLGHSSQRQLVQEHRPIN